MSDEQEGEPSAEPDDSADEGEVEASVEPDDDEDEEDDDEDDEDDSADEATGDRIFSSYGVVSAALGFLSVAAVVFGVVIWSGHRHETGDRSDQNRAMRSAANWTSLLINLNAKSLDAGMTQLRGKTVGQLNTEFDSVMQPYRAVIEKIPGRTTGRIESVSLETGQQLSPAALAPTPPLQTPPAGATRTDTVMVMATSVIEIPDGKPASAQWNLQLGVSEINGTMLISGLRQLG